MLLGYNGERDSSTHKSTHLDGALDGPRLNVKEKQPPVLAPARHGQAVVGDGDTEHTASVPLEGVREGERRGRR